MLKPHFYAFPGDEPLADALATLVRGRVGEVVVRTFADGEQHLRLSHVNQQDNVVLVCTRTFPSPRLLPLVFLGATALEAGARTVGLVAPYLSVLRPERRTRRGDGGTSEHVATLLSAAFDWIVTVAPQLLRAPSLEEFFSVPLHITSADVAIAGWIRSNVQSPLLVGPTSGSDTWTTHLATVLDAPIVAAIPGRDGEKTLQLAGAVPTRWRHCTPVIVRSIVESGSFMRRAVEEVVTLGLAPPICITAHPVFAGTSYRSLLASGAARVVSCNSIPHPTNDIELAPWIADGVTAMIGEGERKKRPEACPA